MKNVISLKVRMLGSNPFLTREYFKLIMLPTLVKIIPNLEIFLFCQHNSTGGGNLELRQTILMICTCFFTTH
jgi:hypothetical protein